MVRDSSSIEKMLKDSTHKKILTSDILFDFSKCRKTKIIDSFKYKYFSSVFQKLIYDNFFASANNCMVQVTFKSEDEANKYFINKYKSIENIEKIGKEVESLFSDLSDKFNDIGKLMEKLKKDQSIDKNKRKVIESIEKASNNLSTYIDKYYAKEFSGDYMDTVGKLFKYFTRKSKE